MDESQLPRVRFFPLALDVGDLAGDQPAAPRADGKFLEQRVHAIARPGVGEGQNLECLGEQRVARQHCDAFAEHLVAGGASAAEIIVVHAR